VQKRLVLGRDGSDLNLAPVAQLEDVRLEIGRWHRYKVAAYTIREHDRF
jgi:hypothetical protein